MATLGIQSWNFHSVYARYGAALLVGVQWMLWARRRSFANDTLALCCSDPEYGATEKIRGQREGKLGVLSGLLHETN